MHCPTTCYSAQRRPGWIRPGGWEYWRRLGGVQLPSSSGTSTGHWGRTSSYRSRRGLLPPYPLCRRRCARPKTLPAGCCQGPCENPSATCRYRRQWGWGGRGWGWRSRLGSPLSWPCYWSTRCCPGCPYFPVAILLIQHIQVIIRPACLI